MCGDFDDSHQIDGELFERFVEMAGQFGVVPGQPDNGAPRRLLEEGTRAAYMRELFKAGLTRSLNDAANLPHGEHMDALAGQAIVFARLAGFLAGQFPPHADLFRNVSEALLEGHNESSSQQLARENTAKELRH